jgi:hypothetical protein
LLHALPKHIGKNKTENNFHAEILISLQKVIIQDLFTNVIIIQWIPLKKLSMGARNKPS